jgi:osmoprotectant transport system substrate-binding protein
MLALAGGLLSGCGTGAAAAGTASTTATSGTTGTSTATVPTQAAVTVVTTPAVPTSELPGHNRPLIQLGDMNTNEQFILGQLYQLALQQQGYRVSLSRNVGAIDAVAQQALRNGTLDLYPNYLGVWNSRVAHLHRRFKTLAGSYGAGRAYARKHGFALLTPTPFSDTSGIAVTSEYAQLNHVRSIPELAHGPRITIGAPLGAFQTGVDGLPALAHAYHLHPGYVQPIIVNSQYGWLGSGNVQAAYSNTTNAYLAGPQFRELQDPKHVFGFGNVVPVTTRKVLAAEGPAFRRTIDRVDALLTLRAIRGLNAEVVIEGHNPTQVARQFLEGNGVLPPTVYAAVGASAGS